MGILDDAIREHLDLKRKHGAPGKDVERLEKEAFGPPARPGDPDFEDEAPGEPDSGEEPFAIDGGDEDQAPPLPEETEPDSEELSAAERGRIDYAELEDTADHPALPGPDTAEHLRDEALGSRKPAVPDEESSEPEAPDPAASPEAPEAPESAIFDQGDVEDAFDDLDLDLEDAPPSAAAEDEEEGDELDIELDLPDLDDSPSEHPIQPPREPAPPETAERPSAPERDQGERQVPEPGSAPVSGGDYEADSPEDDELEDEDEDLLEETPDFLQDTPEGERLWFEQDKPKDFDFDD